MSARTPWGVHHIGSMYAPHGVEAGLADGRWVHAVCEPYYGNPLERLRAAWWVFTGRAQAVVWPKAGELEAALKEPAP